MKIDSKTTLRKEVRQRIESLSEPTKKKHSQKICQHLENSVFFKNHPTLLTYSALPNEPNLLALFHQLSSQQVFCFPRVIGEHLEIRQVNDAVALVPGYANIREPSAELCPLFPQQDLQVILLPGLAFDPSNGARLGKGKGFYDRLLDDLITNPASAVITIGVCFSCQLDQVPEEEHDQRVDVIVTEKDIFTPRSSLALDRQ
ncbi:MAG: 5-formyltetrahydrofolate cyclo-ligase [Verrucomicrobiales bacterium]|nr:5-formyltetrahydrofolate cyclo-ligase [Verrucomicrobiales bacterium]